MTFLEQNDRLRDCCNRAADRFFCSMRIDNRSDRPGRVKPFDVVVLREFDGFVDVLSTTGALFMTNGYGPTLPSRFLRLQCDFPCLLFDRFRTDCTIMATWPSLRVSSFSVRPITTFSSTFCSAVIPLVGPLSETEQSTRKNWIANALVSYCMMIGSAPMLADGSRGRRISTGCLACLFRLQQLSWRCRCRSMSLLTYSIACRSLLSTCHERIKCAAFKR